MRNRISLLFLVLNFSLVWPQYDLDFNSTTTRNVIELTEKDKIVSCKFQPNGYQCKENGSYDLAYYYDIRHEDCRLYNFGSCKPDQNRYTDLKICRDECIVPGDQDITDKVAASNYCKFQADFGLCNGYFPSYYFDITSRRCKGFSYSGCGGNLNRFVTATKCHSVCSGLIEEMSKEKYT